MNSTLLQFKLMAWAKAGLTPQLDSLAMHTRENVLEPSNAITGKCEAKV